MRLTRLSAQWERLRLAQRFFLVATVVLLPGILAIGSWVNGRIAKAVEVNTANAAALYMEGVVGPLVQELSVRTNLSRETIERLDEVLQQPAIRDRVVSMKIWRLDGTIVYSTFKEMVGKSFPPSNLFKQATQGEVGAHFNDDDHEEDRFERAMGKPLLEIYAPVRAGTSRRVIAVAEFYASGETLQAELTRTARWSWLVVALVTGLMVFALSGIVYRGSRTIDIQRSQLQDQIVELKDLLQQNSELQLRLRHSSEDIADVNERTLQRIGGDLHDGPAQLLSYAMLRVNKLGERIEAGDFMQASKDLKRMRLAVEDSLREIRNISSGLTLPELQDVPLDRSIELAIRTHEEHTTTVVAREIDLALDTTPHPIKICIYRFVQEGLANAYWHAGGEGQKVTAQGGVPLVVSVSDAGPGINAMSASSSGLGLTGMRARIEAHGGLLRVEKGGCNGTVLTASFCQNALRPRENNHGSTQ